MAGVEDRRHDSSAGELGTLSELRRGVFARRSIASGSVIGNEDLFYAIPAGSGQLVANDLSKYTEYRAIAQLRTQ
jgi:hypothetical protein